METCELLESQLRTGLWTITEAAKGLTEHEFYQRLPHGGESADWIFGHLATNEDWFLSILTGSPLELDQALRDVYQADFPPPSQPVKLVGATRMIEIFRKQRSRVIQALRSADPTSWGAPAPDPMPAIFKTVGDVWGVLGTHQYWHIGQLMSIRTMLCKPAFQFPPHKASATEEAASRESSDRLTVPSDGPRVNPREPEQVNAYVRAEFDKAMETWGIHNNLARTMGCHPLLALTEVDYANSFIFKRNEFVEIPNPKMPALGTVLFPAGGFVDRVTKELVITLVSLVNRSRYSITHHAVISWGTLSQEVEGVNPDQKKRRAEAMLLNLVDASGNPTYKTAPPFGKEPLYTDFQLAALNLAEKANKNVHAVSDAEFNEFRAVCRREAKRQIRSSGLHAQFKGKGPDKEYIEAYIDGMIVEITWCICHFSGLLNRWFTLLKVRDETFDINPLKQNFVEAYDANVPSSIKRRNNSLLGPSGWGY